MQIYIIDGNAYIYRFFHAFKGLSNSKGIPTNAIFGFGGMLFRLIFEIKAQAIAVVFDSKEPTDRHQYYPQYKANRPSMPDELIVQIPIIKRLLKTLSINTFEMPGIEADDIIGTIAQRCADLNHKVLLMSGDKDFLQLVNDRISIFDFQKDKILDITYVLDKFGLEPSKIPDVMALTGDSIDNIPGVKGIGDKKAVELIKEFSDVETLISMFTTIRNERVKRLIEENTDNIRLSKKLSVINCSIPIDINVEDMIVGKFDWEGLKEFINEYDLKSFIKYLPIDYGKNNTKIIYNEKMLISYIRGDKTNLEVNQL